MVFHLKALKGKTMTESLLRVGSNTFITIHSWDRKTIGLYTVIIVLLMPDFNPRSKALAVQRAEGNPLV